MCNKICCIIENVSEFTTFILASVLLLILIMCIMYEERTVQVIYITFDFIELTR